MKKIKIFLAVCIIAVMALSVVGCAKEPNGSSTVKPEDTVISEEADDAYCLTIKGMIKEDIVVTKKQIKELYKTKPVNLDNVCASDKTDDDNNPIPHTVKGVYLDDIMLMYGEAISGYFGAMTLKGLDGYETQVVASTYNIEEGGSKMIVALEYDNVVLDANQKSGALRGVFPNQIANSWAKKLSVIEFSSSPLSPSIPSKVSFVESIGAENYGSFVRMENVGGVEKEVTRYGISLKKLFDGGILEGEVSDKMLITAWEYKTNGANGNWTEYKNWKSYDYYKDSFLVNFSQIAGEDKEAEVRAYIFDGANIHKGMSVKNTLSLSVNKTALMSIEIAKEKFTVNGHCKVADALDYIGLFEENAGYKLVTHDGEINVTSAQMKSAEFTKEGQKIKIDGVLYTVKSIEKI